MTSLSSSLKIIINILIVIIIAKIISLFISLYLPDDGIELELKYKNTPKYQRVDFKNMIGSSDSKLIVKDISNAISITNMVLKALYGKENKGYVVIALKSTPKKTSIISVGEKYQGYTLKSISRDSAVFTKLSKDYILEIDYVKDIANKHKKMIKVVKQKEYNHIVPRTEIAKYIKNPKRLSREISIKEILNAGSIAGFKITKIKKNSNIEKLGLKKGDVIIRANNIDLKSYKDVLDIYKDINKLKVLQLVVLRDNIEREFVYEIN
jgi:general secretion pathway protein C